jgi:son of sevenless
VLCETCCNLSVEGPLQKFAGRRYTDRYVFLFDGLIILTKQNLKRISVTGPSAEYKLKEKFQMRKVDIVDREDAEGTQHFVNFYC